MKRKSSSKKVIFPETGISSPIRNFDFDNSLKSPPRRKSRGPRSRGSSSGTGGSSSSSDDLRFEIDDEEMNRCVFCLKKWLTCRGIFEMVNSLGCSVVVSFGFTIFLIVILGGYCSFQSAFLHHSVKEINREKSLMEMYHEIDAMKERIKGSVMGLSGMEKKAVEWFTNQQEDFEDMVEFLFPYYQSVSEELGREDVEIGVSLIVNSSYHLSLEYYNGIMKWNGNDSAYQYNVQFDEIFNSTNITLITTTEPVVYSETVYRNQSEKFAKYVYSVGEGISEDALNDVEGFWEYSYGGGKMEEYDDFYAFVVSTKVGLSYLNDHLFERISPVHAVFLIEIDQDIELAGKCSDGHNLIDVNGLSFHPSGTNNHYIGDAVEKVLNDDVVFQRLRNGEIYMVNVGSSEVGIMFIASEISSGWLLMNAYTFWEQYNQIGTSLILFASIVSTMLTVTLCCWGVICLRTRLNLFKLSREIRKVNLKNLDDVSFSTRCFSSFNEIRLLERNLMFMVEKLKKFRAFLPSHLIYQEEPGDNDSSTDERSSTTPSSGGIITNFHLGIIERVILLVRIDLREELEKNDESLFRIIESNMKGSGVFQFDCKGINIIYLGSVRVKKIVGKIAVLHEILSKLKGGVYSPRFFVLEGESLVGNLGNQVMKKFVCEGEVKKTMNVVQKLSPNSKIIVCSNCEEKLEGSFEKRLIHKDGYFEISTKSTRKFSVGGREPDWKDYNEACEEVLNGEFDKAMKYFESESDQIPHLSKYWISVIERMMEGK